MTYDPILSTTRRDGVNFPDFVVARRYSGFDSALYRNREAEWLFLKEKATLHDARDVNK